MVSFLELKKVGELDGIHSHKQAWRRSLGAHVNDWVELMRLVSCQSFGFRQGDLLRTGVLSSLSEELGVVRRLALLLKRS